MGAAALVLAEGFPRQLIALFGAANESAYYTEFAVKAFRVYLLDGVLYSMPVADALTFALAAVIIVRTYRELNAEGARG